MADGGPDSPSAAIASRRLPAYDELPPAPRGGRSGWGVFGADDSIGLLNLQTPERVAAAARLVRDGQVFSLNAPLDALDPPLFMRGALDHTVIGMGGSAYDDKLDNYFPQASSQWDSLAHVAYDTDRFYNGATGEDIDAKTRNTIEHWARRGIAGRAVLLDIDAAWGGAGNGFDPATPRVTVGDLEAARRLTGLDWQVGDVLLLYTGFLAWYARQDPGVRAGLADLGQFAAVGLEPSEDMARYLWDSHICAAASDNPSLEVWPPDLSPEGMPFGFLHRMLIGQFGLAIGELWWLEGLARACREDGRYEAFLTSAPTHVNGGIGSSANAAGAPMTGAGAAGPEGSHPGDWARPVVHWELVARDPEAQGGFYRALCHWDIGAGPIMEVPAGLGGPEPGPSGHIRQGDRPGVTLFVQVRDLGASLAEAVELGARLVAEPFDVPGGPTLAAVEDPEGNPLVLVQQ